MLCKHDHGTHNHGNIFANIYDGNSFVVHLEVAEHRISLPSRLPLLSLPLQVMMFYNADLARVLESWFGATARVPSFKK